LGLADPVTNNQNSFTVVRTIGSPGFGILTIKGNSDLKKKNVTTIISTQTAARKIYQQSMSHQSKSGNSDVDNSILSEDYL
jgi:hypothetical protein